MTLKYIWKSFQPRLSFPRPFQQSLPPWHAFASHGLPAIAELLVKSCYNCWIYLLVGASSATTRMRNIFPQTDGFRFRYMSSCTVTAMTGLQTYKQSSAFILNIGQYLANICVRVCVSVLWLSSVQFSNNIYVSRKSNNSGLWRLRSCVEASDKHNWL